MESIYDILALREDGEEQAAAPQDTPVSGQEANDDDFSIDTSLDDGGEDTAADAPAPDDMGQDAGPEDTGEEAAPGGAEQPAGEEGQDNGANEDNTDIFSSLSAEEQQLKIKELKKLYCSLYNSCDEILDRINNLETDENNLVTVTRVSTAVYDMKKYISDYLALTFANKSYVENDITFNRFLLVIKSVSEILDSIAKQYEKEEKENEKKIDKN